VWAGDIEDLDLEIPPGSFDAIDCADVLEHLREPARVLKQIRGWLAPDGCIVASIPNVRHRSVVRPLLEGNAMGFSSCALSSCAVAPLRELLMLA
jgi:O-antigen biosynthesis protein